MYTSCAMLMVWVVPTCTQSCTQFTPSAEAQLEQHVLQEKVVVHRTAIMLALRFRTSIALQLDELPFVDTRVTRGRARLPDTACAWAELEEKQQTRTAAAIERPKLDRTIGPGFAVGLHSNHLVPMASPKERV
jgi:hypothetical protein